MNPDHLTSMLAAGPADDPERTPDCPDEHQVAGYVDGGLDAAARAVVELHLADCGYCLELVELLSRERDAEEVKPVSGEVLAQARALATRGARHRWRLAPQWAAAAALVVAVPLLLQLGRNLERDPEGQGRPEALTTRNVTSAAVGLQVLAPGAGTEVDAERLSFRWTEVSGTPYYDVRIVNDVGDVVIQQRVVGTTWRPPAQLNLRRGGEYFVHIDAYPAGDKAVSSDHVRFRISD
jgi:hypothetical protein